MYNDRRAIRRGPRAGVPSARCPPGPAEHASSGSLNVERDSDNPRSFLEHPTSGAPAQIFRSGRRRALKHPRCFLTRARRPRCVCEVRCRHGAPPASLVETWSDQSCSAASQPASQPMCRGSTAPVTAAAGDDPAGRGCRLPAQPDEINRRQSHKTQLRRVYIASPAAGVGWSAHVPHQCTHCHSGCQRRAVHKCDPSSRPMHGHPQLDHRNGAAGAGDLMKIFLVLLQIVHD